MNDKVISPVSGGSNVTLIDSIKVKRVIDSYLKTYGLDVGGYFKELENINIYKCNETGYRFYYPLNLAGDSSFYESLQQNKGYYMPWKWEHEVTLNYLKNGNKILEVGCAHGDFLESIHRSLDLPFSIGLELNETAVKKSKHYEVINQDIVEFSRNNEEVFDTVCSFQVVEHIANVGLFIKSQIRCLKVGGLLVVSVPNNESYVVHRDSALNQPPHHMGLWDSNSLKNLENIFPIKLIDIHIEPLQDRNVNNYINSYHYSGRDYFTRIKRRLDIITGRYQKRFNYAISHKNEIKGHTVLAAYKKIA